MSLAVRGSTNATCRAAPRWLICATSLAFLILYLLPIGVRPIASPDEVRNGVVASEMLGSGDWIVPRFDGVRYFEKPVLGYWLESAALAALGRNAFALRLPQVLATALASLVVFGLVRRYATSFAAALAALIHSTTFLVAGVGTFAVLDAFLALFLSAALATLYCALEEPSSARRRAWLVACGAACGVAFLTKGFVAVAVVAIVAAPYLAARRRWREIFTVPWVPLAAAALVVLPWAIAIARREPDFWRYFFWVEHVQRFFGGGAAQHAQPVWYHLAFLPLTGWPWILLLPAALAAAWPARREPFVAFLLCWIAAPFVMFSASSGKLPTYVLPCFAPLSMFLAVGLERYAALGRSRIVRVAAIAAGMVALVTALGVLAAQRFMRTPPYAADEWPKLALLICVLAGSVAAVALTQARAVREEGLLAVALCGAALLLAAQFMLPRSVLEHVAPAAAVAELATGSYDASVVADGQLVGTAAWVLDHDAGLAQLIAANRGRRATVLIVAAKEAASLATAVPRTARRQQLGQVVVWRIEP